MTGLRSASNSAAVKSVRSGGLAIDAVFVQGRKESEPSCEELHTAAKLQAIENVLGTATMSELVFDETTAEARAAPLGQITARS